MCLCILFPYLLKVDVETFNPIEKSIEALKKILPAKFREYEVYIDTNELNDNVDKYGWSFFIGKSNSPYLFSSKYFQNCTAHFHIFQDWPLLNV